MDESNTTAVSDNITAPANAAIDGRSASLQSASDQIERIAFVEGRTALSGTNAAGGKRSGWGTLRQAKAVPPGAT